MKKIGDIIGSVTKKYELDADAQASLLLEEAVKYLEEVFGKENIGKGKKICGMKYQNGLLFFEVSSSAWNNRLFMEKMNLLAELQKKFPKMTLRDVRGRVSGKE